MHHRIAAGRLRTAGALALAAALAACASGPPPAASVPPPAAAGISGSSAPPAALRGGYGYGSSEPAAPTHFVASRTTPLRQGPRNGFGIVAVLPPGTPATTNGYVAGDWWQVQTRYGTGWVYSRDLAPG